MSIFNISLTDDEMSRRKEYAAERTVAASSTAVKGEGSKAPLVVNHAVSALPSNVASKAVGLSYTNPIANIATTKKDRELSALANKWHGDKITDPQTALAIKSAKEYASNANSLLPQNVTLLKLDRDMTVKNAKKTRIEQDFIKAYDAVAKVIYTENPDADIVKEIGTYADWKQRVGSARSRDGTVESRIKSTLANLDNPILSTGVATTEAFLPMVTSENEKNRNAPMTYDELMKYSDDPAYTYLFKDIKPEQIGKLQTMKTANTIGDLMGRIAGNVLVGYIAAPASASIATKIAKAAGSTKKGAAVGEFVGQLVPNAIADVTTDVPYGISKGNDWGDIVKETAIDVGFDAVFGAAGTVLDTITSKGSNLAKTIASSKIDIDTKELDTLQTAIQGEMAKLTKSGESISYALSDKTSRLSKAVKSYDEAATAVKAAQNSTREFGTVMTNTEKATEKYYKIISNPNVSSEDASKAVDALKADNIDEFLWYSEAKKVAANDTATLAEIEEAYKTGNIVKFITNKFTNKELDEAAKEGITMAMFAEKHAKEVLQNDNSAVAQIIKATSDAETRFNVIDDVVRKTYDAKNTLNTGVVTPRTVSTASNFDDILNDIGAEQSLKNYINATTFDAPINATVEVAGKELTGAQYADIYAAGLPKNKDALSAIEFQLNADLASAVYSENESKILKIKLQMFATKKEQAVVDVLSVTGDENDLVNNMRGYFKSLLNKNATILDNKTFLETLAGKNLDYVRIGNDETEAAAKKLIDTAKKADELQTKILTVGNKYKDKKQLFDKDTVAAGIMLTKKAINNGDIETATALTEVLGEQATKLGQAVQIYSLITKMSPEGVLKYTQKIYKGVMNENAAKAIEDIAGTLKQADDEIIAPVAKQKAKQLDDVLKRADNSAEALAKRIETAAKPQVIDTPEIDKTRQMINELATIAKQTMPEKTVKYTDNFAIVADAVRNRSEYKSVWDEAQKILSAKYSDDSVMLSVLDDYLQTGLTTVASEKRLARIISEAKKSTGISMQDLIGEYYSSEKKMQSSLANYIVERTGLQGEDAEYLRNNIIESIGKSTDEARIKHLENALASPKNRKVKGAAMGTAKRNNNSTLADKIFQQIKYGGTEKNYRDAFSEALGIPTLTEEQAIRLVELSSRAEKTSGAAQTYIYEDIYKEIASKMPVSFGDKIKAWRMMSMLANAKTHVRNIVSNAALKVIDKPTDVITQGLEKWFVKNNWMEQSEATKYFGWKKGEAGALRLIEAETALDEALPIMQKMGRYNTSEGAVKQARTIFKTKALEKVRTFTGDTLDAEDIVFAKKAFIDAYGQLLAARGLTKGNDEIFDLALEKALEMTFRSNNSMNNLLMNLKRNKSIGWAVDLVVPFTKTPSNILKEAINYSTFGGIRGIVNVVNAVNGKGATETATALNQIAKGITGTALTGIGYWLGRMGYVTVVTPYQNKKGALAQSTGQQDYSIKIGDIYISLDWLQPSSIPFFSGAAIAEAIEKSISSEKGLKNTLDAVVGVPSAISDLYFQASFLQGVQDFLGNNSYGSATERYAFSLLNNFAGQFIPTAVGQLARSIDTTQRSTSEKAMDTGIEKQSTQTLNKIKAKLPGASYTLPASYDIWGDEKTRTGMDMSKAGSIALNVLQQFILPSNIKVNSNSDNVTNEVVRLAEATGEQKGTPPEPSDDLIKEYSMTDEQYAEYSSQLGQRMYDIAKAVINGSRYSSLSDEEKAKALSAGYSKGAKVINNSWKIKLKEVD